MALSPQERMSTMGIYLGGTDLKFYLGFSSGLIGDTVENIILHCISDTLRGNLTPVHFLPSIYNFCVNE